MIEREGTAHHLLLLCGVGLGISLSLLLRNVLLQSSLRLERQGAYLRLQRLWKRRSRRDRQQTAEGDPLDAPSL